mgnify:CR=1 FL=1
MLELTREEIMQIPEGMKMDRLINERFYREERPRFWSQRDADAIVLMLDIEQRNGNDFVLTRAGKEYLWYCGSNFKNSLMEDWAEGDTWRLAVCRAALLMTIKAV